MPTVGTVLYDSTVPSLRGALGRASSGAAASRLIRIAKSSVLYEVWLALTEREGQVGRLPRYLFVSCLVSLMCGKLSSPDQPLRACCEQKWTGPHSYCSINHISHDRMTPFTKFPFPEPLPVSLCLPSPSRKVDVAKKKQTNKK